MISAWTYRRTHSVSRRPWSCSRKSARFTLRWGVGRRPGSGPGFPCKTYNRRRTKDVCEQLTDQRADLDRMRSGIDWCNNRLGVDGSRSNGPNIVNTSIKAERYNRSLSSHEQYTMNYSHSYMIIALGLFQLPRTRHATVPDWTF
jgi:hypothetical protein